MSGASGGLHGSGESGSGAGTGRGGGMGEGRNTGAERRRHRSMATGSDARIIPSTYIRMVVSAGEGMGAY